MSTPHSHVLESKCECGDFVVIRQAMRVTGVGDEHYAAEPETELEVQQCLKCKRVWLIPRRDFQATAPTVLSKT